MNKRIPKIPIFILVIAVLVTGIAYYGVSTQAQDPPKLDLGDMTLQINKVEYALAPAYNDALDNVEIFVGLYNNKGMDVACKPAGELYLISSSGKQYPTPEIAINEKINLFNPYDLQILQYLNQDTQKLIDMGKATADELLPAGLFRCGFVYSIERGDKIIAVLYKNGDIVKKLDISQVKTVVHERKTELGEEDYVVQRDRELYGP
ncbi:Uncharacterized [Syntrophomonas zehnderi OL-4]|uniref:Uncharacterized n=1 Tax=Syntrophomonas zehnderi OL-4 TaxID=690567 RepID=A0A0E3W2G0_9FIRM|nr:hypothetical protein [Syntrophomonas zehnderi]CFW97842.1 Uncharacterized [Syntrophomonas zehnderi OL-4]